MSKHYTADNITDEQIRSLYDVLRDTHKNRMMLHIALYGPSQREANAGHTQAKARARCAEIINARATEGKS